MKKHILLLTSIFGLTACATFQQQQVDWRGQNFDSYIQAKGVPTSKYSLQNGNTAYSFKTTCRYANMMGETLVTVGADNLIVSISTPTKCPSYYESTEYKLDQMYQQEQQKQAQRELEKSERAQKIKTLEGALRGNELSISLQKTRISSTQSDVDLAQKGITWQGRLSTEEYEKKLNAEKAELERLKKQNIDYETELNQLKSMQYR